ncbi:MAG: hypothetical protein LBO74_08585 [Candidatus Symbiothrix sp.]|jgi:hypothetical protein|nr:hypothetical protein [Candidatus Symbiothrix sp.]
MKRNEDDILHRNAAVLFEAWRNDWNKFIREALGVTLDKEQQAIVTAVQHNKLVSVRSGTARGKDFVAACVAVSFLYLTPRWNKHRELAENTKVALTAPTDRQVKNIMMPEISRLYNRAKRRGFTLPGRLNTYDIRTDYEEWFLTGFKADENNHEAWSGFHAVNTMFVVTEATGIMDDTYTAIEGNLQGNSRLLLVFNPNTSVGYAARSQKTARWKKFCLNSLTAPNVMERKIIFPGQVDYEWVLDKVENWCEAITEDDIKESENDFQFDGIWYRPSDLFRKKVLGEFPKIDEDILIPPKWIELAQERWSEYKLTSHNNAIIGVDVAGMGRDCTVFCYRFNNYVEKFNKSNSGGKANHMKVAGQITNDITIHSGCAASIDTIGEGAGVYSRVVEVCEQSNGKLDEDTIVSCKYSEGAKDNSGNDLTDITGQYTFANMRAYLFWCVRDWLNPDSGMNAMLPPGGSLFEESTEIKWSFLSNGRIIIEPKEDIKNRLGHSPDEFDALANTFHPKAIKTVGQVYNTEYDEDFEDVLY